MAHFIHYVSNRTLINVVAGYHSYLGGGPKPSDKLKERLPRPLTCNVPKGDINQLRPRVKVARAGIFACSRLNISCRRISESLSTMRWAMLLRVSNSGVPLGYPMASPQTPSFVSMRTTT